MKTSNKNGLETNYWQDFSHLVKEQSNDEKNHAWSILRVLMAFLKHANKNNNNIETTIL